MDLEFAIYKRVYLKHSHKKVNCEIMDVFINLIVVIVSLCISVSNYHVVNFKYITNIFVHYIPQ